MSKAVIRSVIAIASIGVLAFAAEATAQTNFLNDLGVVAPGLGIIDSGEVVLQNYLYRGGTLTALPASISAGGISSSGTIAGTYLTNPNAGVALYNGATVTEIPTTYGSLDPSVTNTATGVNAAGTVIGYWYMLNGEEGDGFQIVGGISTVLVFPNAGAQSCGSGLAAGGAGEALAINDSGQITGFAPNVGYGLGPVTGAAPCSMHAFLYDNGAYTDLGPGYGYAINANGAVTGSNYKNISQNGQFTTVLLGAFLYANGALTQLPSGANAGYGINSADYIVGDGVNGAFFYDGVVIDLNTFILNTAS